MPGKRSHRSKPSSPAVTVMKVKGGETHQQSAAGEIPLTTNQGLPVADNQNSLRAGVRGPALLEDFILREKITHFDHERTPERIVHARGAGAHGYFQPYRSMREVTKAAFLSRSKGQDPGICKVLHGGRGTRIGRPGPRCQRFCREILHDGRQF